MKEPTLNIRLQDNEKYYSVYYEQLKNRTDKRDYRELMGIFYNLLPDKTGMVLDIGCGLGQHLQLFKQLGLNAVGVEPSKSLRDICIKNGLYVMDGNFESLDSLSFNTEIAGIWCAASLLHVPEKELLVVLKKLKNLLITNGVLFLTVRVGTGSYLDSFDGNNSQSEKRFIQLYQPDDLITALTAVGFAIQYKRIEDSYWGRKTEWISVVATGSK